MKISPLDIRKQEFGKQVRGYDVEEVTSFLEMVADEFEALLNRNKELEKEVEFYKEKLNSYQEKESTLQDSMKDVQQIQKQKTEKADEQAEFIIQKAYLEADKVVQEARRKHQRLLDDIHRLESQRRGYLIKMHHLLRSQMELIDVLEDLSPEKEEAAVKKAARIPETQVAGEVRKVPAGTVKRRVVKKVKRPAPPGTKTESPDKPDGEQ